MYGPVQSIEKKAGMKICKMTILLQIGGRKERQEEYPAPFVYAGDVEHSFGFLFHHCSIVG